MQALRTGDLRAGLQLLDAVSAAAVDWRALARAGVAALPALVASEVTTLSVCDLRSGRRKVIGSPDSRINEQDAACFDRHFSEHPLVRFHAYERGQGAHRISDSLPYSRFRHTPLYCDYYRRIGIDHVVALPIEVQDDVLVSFVLNRCGRDFSDREVAALDIVREPLSRMFRQAREAARAQEALAELHTLFERTGRGWMRLGHGRELQAASAAALAWVAECTQATPRAGQPLPTPLDRWLARALMLLHAGRAAPAELVLACAGRRLRLQALPEGGVSGDGGILLLLERIAAPAHSLRLDAMRLTAREREVLHWVATGKTDREIAALLGCSHRTVQKHLEHVYPKLGVETRTAAVMRALEFGLQ
jgi:DNA-binding CsgD family transcriptional regulator